MPKVLATEKVVCPPRTNRTASCLNSSVYCPRTVPAIPKPSKADPTQSALGDVLQGQGHNALRDTPSGQGRSDRLAEVLQSSEASLDAGLSQPNGLREKMAWR